MVIALYSDRCVFTHESVKWPKVLGKIYGKDAYQKFRKMFPCYLPQPLSTKRRQPHTADHPRKKRSVGKRPMIRRMLSF
jgi:hypothetical protein